MKEITNAQRHMIQAIMSVTHELKGLKESFDNLKVIVDTNEKILNTIATFKDRIETRISVLQNTWSTHLNNSLIHFDKHLQTLMASYLRRVEAFTVGKQKPTKKPKAKKKTKKVSKKKAKK